MTIRAVLAVIATVTILLLAAGIAGAGAVLPFNGSDVGTFGVPGLCGDGALNVVIGGEGTATHVGRYTYTASECFNPTTGAFSGSATLTAANGDQIWGAYGGGVGTTGDPDVITYEETLTITGGSGRFADAGGELVVSGIANLATGDYHQSFRGWIANLGLTRR